MKIAYIVDEYPPFFRGGLGTYAMEISRQFVKSGHEITVFSRNNGDDLTRDLWEGIEVHRPYLMDFIDVLPIVVPEDVKRWHVEGQMFFQETLHYNFMAASKAVNQLVRVEGRRFDLVAAHDWLAALAGIMVKRNLNIPLVFHFHSTEKGRTGDGSETIREIERIAAMEADLILTVSYAMRDELVSLGYPEQKIRVVYNGVDAEKYRPDAYSKDEVKAFRNRIGIGNDPMIFFIGRLTWVKGVDVLIRAMPLIVSEVPDAKLVILGVGDEEELVNHLVKFQCEDCVIFRPEIVDERERILYFAASDVAVFPSKYEPFGIVCTEAMAMGKPVVVGARGTSGMREQVISGGHETCGFHVNPYDPSDIATYVVKLLKDPALRRQYGQKGRKRVETHFKWEIIAQRTLEVYAEAIEKHPLHQQGTRDP